MKHPFKLHTLVMMVFAATTWARAAGIDGQWTAEFDTQVGVQKYLFEFKSTGEQIAGKATWERMGGKGVTELKEVRIAGDQVSFVEPFTIPDAGQEIRIEYKGTLAGDELKCIRNVGDFATENFMAKRVAGPAAYQPPASPRATYNFNPDWKFIRQDVPGAEQAAFDDTAWTTVSTPHTWNDVDTYRAFISHSGGERSPMYTGIGWYRKHFKLPASAKDGKVFLEFEGLKQAGRFFVNGRPVGKI